MLVSKKISNEEECYKTLAVEGIVGQACEDYLDAKKTIYLEQQVYNPKVEIIRDAKRMLSDCKRFFKSDWYTRLCSIPCDVMMDKLEKEFEERKANNFKKKTQNT